VAEIGGVDFSRPVSAGLLREIVDAMDAYAVCVFRATALDDSTMHRATPFEDKQYRRDMRRTTVLDTEDR
jgi:hypothetical protein